MHKNGATDAVTDTNALNGQAAEDIHLCDGQIGNTIEADGITQSTPSSQPTRRGRPVVVPNSSQGFEPVPAQRSALRSKTSVGNGPAPTRSERLGNAHNPPTGMMPRRDRSAQPVQAGITGHVRIGAQIKIEERTLCTFRQDAFAFGECRVNRCPTSSTKG